MAKGMTQWVSLTNESSYGVTQTSTPTTDWIRLTGDNAFSVLPNVMTHEIKSADARNRRVINVKGRIPVAGRLSTYLYSDSGASATPFCDRILGWATTLASDELASYTARRFDGVRNRELLGGKVNQLHLYATSDTEEGLFKLDLDLIFQKFNATDPVTFTEPAQTVFPKSIYRLQESTGGLSAYSGGAATRTLYRNFDLTINNNLQPSWDENDFISDLNYQGRTIDLVVATRFRSKTDRDNFESQAAHTISMLLTKVSPAHTLTLTFNAANYISALDRTLALGGNTYETLHFKNFDDTVAGGDFAYSFT